nr:hypothetical protein pLIS51_00461 [Listeria seeligeri]
MGSSHTLNSFLSDIRFDAEGEKEAERGFLLLLSRQVRWKAALGYYSLLPHRNGVFLDYKVDNLQIFFRLLSIHRYKIVTSFMVSNDQTN